LHALKEAVTSNRLRTLGTSLPVSNGVDKMLVVYLYGRSVVVL